MGPRCAQGWLIMTSLVVVGCKGTSRDPRRRPTQSATSPASIAPPEPRASPSAINGDLVAFPPAEGLGARTRGGRGGSVCKVTSVAKAGAGASPLASNTTACALWSSRRAGLRGAIRDKAWSPHHRRPTLSGRNHPLGWPLLRQSVRPQRLRRRRDSSCLIPKREP